MTCERAWECRAIDEGRLSDTDVAAFRRHARTCQECRKALAEMDALRVATSQLPTHEPSQLELRRVRIRVLRDAMSTPGPRRLGILLGGIAATIVLVLVLAHYRTAPEAFGGKVIASSDAVWTQAREDSIERVTLAQGTVTLHVRHQLPGNRFLVVVPDGEIEVRGTTFEVTVGNHKTSRVHVDDGTVFVRVGSDSVVLSAGDTWPRAEPGPVAPEPPKPLVRGLAPSASSAAVDASAPRPLATRPSSVPPSRCARGR